MADIFANVRKALAVLTPKQNIFLLSHMRSYTSLFGHILGSNPEICGYYEMHIGYYSWRSLVRQKLVYFKHEDPKPGFRYMFDKVLHNEHSVSADILNRTQTKVIFCLRHPQEVIPSILRLYKRVDPRHEFNSESFATEYYIQRLAMLERMAGVIQRDFFYLDAEALKSETQQCLQLLSDWLQLGIELVPDYELQRNTSKKRFGDSSEQLREGTVVNQRSDYVDFDFDADLLKRAVVAYQSARTRLVQSSAHRCVIR